MIVSALLPTTASAMMGLSTPKLSNISVIKKANRTKRRVTRQKRYKKNRKKRKSKRSSSRRRGIACHQLSAAKILSRSQKYQHYITAAARRNRISADLITAIITAESCFHHRARSPKGAAGLMQLMPATGRRFGVANRMRYVPANNIAGGSQYLGYLLRRYHGNLRYAIAAYNAGEGNVDRYHGIPPFRETRNYVKRVIAVYRRIHHFNKRYKPRKRAQLIAQAGRTKRKSTSRQHQLALRQIQHILNQKRARSKRIPKKVNRRRANVKRARPIKKTRYVSIHAQGLDLKAVKLLLK